MVWGVFVVLKIIRRLKKYIRQEYLIVGAMAQLFGRYGWVDYRLSGDLPYLPIASVRFEGDEPAVINKCLGRADCDLFISDWIPDGARGVAIDIAHTDGWLCPVLEEPVEEELWIAFVWLSSQRGVVCKCERLTSPFHHRDFP